MSALEMTGAKSLGYSKSSRLVGIIFVLLEILMISSTMSLERIDVAERMRTYQSHFLERDADNTKLIPQQIFGLKNGEDLKKETSVTINGVKRTKYQETYKGLDVMGETIVVGTKKNGVYTGDATGNLVDGISKDVPDINPKISKSDALKIATSFEGDNAKDVIFNPNSDVKLEIFITGDHDAAAKPVHTSQIKGSLKAKLVYVLSYEIDRGQTPSKPTVIIDAKTGKILDSWQSINT